MRASRRTCRSAASRRPSRAKRCSTRSGSPIGSFDAPFKRDSGIAVLRGNLAPDGAIIKPSAASPHLMRHTGPAVVFESIEDLHERINDDALATDENSVMVLKYCGPKGYPRMAEVGNMPLPPKLLKRGITDVVRISDARMSGTAYGTVVLHTAPESAAGGHLALVQTGDLITLDVAERRLHLHVDDAELAKRRAAWTPPPEPMERGYVKLYVDHRAAGERRRRPRVPRRAQRREGAARQPLTRRRHAAVLRPGRHEAARGVRRRVRAKRRAAVRA
jgi:dihydroxyacid dehydratase/phosphogluconate dehydratase